MLVLDSLPPLERLKLSNQLTGKIAELEKAENPLAKLKLTQAINALLEQLGESVPKPDGEVSASEDDGLSDDPNSPNYRYKDTGYIAGSRKEQAASMIRAAARNGQRVRHTDIDWDAVEENPRQAAELITKANLLGKTDWEQLQASGMEPAAGFLIQKIYASIASSPNADLPGGGGRLDNETLAIIKERDAAGVTSGKVSRKDFAIGLETIRDRLENKKTVDEVMAVVDEIRDELDGVQLTAEQADQVQKLMDIYREKKGAVKAIKDQYDALYKPVQAFRHEINSLKWDQEKRTRRKWKPDPEIDRKIADVQAKLEEAEKVADEFWQDNPAVFTSSTGSKERKLPNGNITYATDAEWEAMQYYYEASAIQSYAKRLNLVTNQTTRSWISFGEKFWKLVHYRSYKGSDSFAEHVVNAKNGRIPDWSWAEKDGATKPKKATQQEIGFHLKVATQFDRKGGKPVSVSGTKALEEMIGFRAIQSGNWVLKDPLSAKFHVENTAAAMSDLSDMLGIDTHLLGFGGRLGMAFGARGTGGKDAAAAHYESIERVINITKMKGGGALGHEWWHALDNVMHEMVSQEVHGGKREFVSVNPGLLPPGAVQQAVMELQQAMTTGTVRMRETVEYTDGDIKTAKFNMETPRYDLPKNIKEAGSAEVAVLAVEKYFGSRSDRSSLKRKKDWKKLAAAYYHNDKVNAKSDGSGYWVRLRTGRETSSFEAEAQRLDGPGDKPYWGSGQEMSARAFQAYIEDKLAANDRLNDYLSWGADNKYHYDEMFGIQWKPYPEGEERTKINAAFDKLFDAIRKEQVFEKAVGNKALMDAIFPSTASRE